MSPWRRLWDRWFAEGRPANEGRRRPGSPLANRRLPSRHERAREWVRRVPERVLGYLAVGGLVLFLGSGLVALLSYGLGFPSPLRIAGLTALAGAVAFEIAMRVGDPAERSRSLPIRLLRLVGFVSLAVLWLVAA